MAFDGFFQIFSSEKEEQGYGDDPVQPPYSLFHNVHFVRIMDKLSSHGVRQRRVVIVSTSELILVKPGSTQIKRIIPAERIEGVYKQLQPAQFPRTGFALLIVVPDEHDLLLLQPKEKKAGMAAPDDLMTLLHALTVCKRVQRQLLPIYTLPPSEDILRKAFLIKPASFRYPTEALEEFLDSRTPLPKELPPLESDHPADEGAAEAAPPPHQLPARPPPSSSASQAPPAEERGDVASDSGSSEASTASPLSKSQRRVSFGGVLKEEPGRTGTPNPSTTVTDEGSSSGSEEVSPTLVFEEDKAMRKEWVSDKAAKQCNVCGARFTFSKRKHHCRKCGEVVCAQCSPYESMVRGYANMVRVCTTCYREEPSEPTSPAPFADSPDREERSSPPLSPTASAPELLTSKSPVTSPFNVTSQSTHVSFASPSPPSSRTSTRRSDERKAKKDKKDRDERRRSGDRSRSHERRRRSRSKRRKKEPPPPRVDIDAYWSSFMDEWEAATRATSRYDAGPGGGHRRARQETEGLLLLHSGVSPYLGYPAPSLLPSTVRDPRLVPTVPL
eukprot:Sspe_Gene.64131::Locus_37536_Transcript_1_1_Confidence_1.000_Length_1842::g.64131::m.64131